MIFQLTEAYNTWGLFFKSPNTSKYQDAYNKELQHIAKEEV